MRPCACVACTRGPFAIWSRCAARFTWRPPNSNLRPLPLPLLVSTSPNRRLLRSPPPRRGTSVNPQDSEEGHPAPRRLAMAGNPDAGGGAKVVVAAAQAERRVALGDLTNVAAGGRRLGGALTVWLLRCGICWVP
jgi:hypothetical protein